MTVIFYFILFFFYLFCYHAMYGRWRIIETNHHPTSLPNYTVQNTLLKGNLYLYLSSNGFHISTSISICISEDEEETEQFPIRIFTQLCTLDYTKISAARDLSHFLIEISRSHFPRSPLMYLYWYFSHFLIEISRSSLTFNVFVFVFVPLFNRNLKVLAHL